MRVAHLILAHEHPERLARLTHRLADGNDSVFVHLDARFDAAPFVAAVGPAVRFTARRHACEWSGYGLVEAALELIRCALADGEADYFSLLSGADYPVRALPEFRAHLRAGGDREYFSLRPAGIVPPGHGVRFQSYWFGGRQTGIAGRIEKLLRYVPWRRRLPRGLQPCFGSQWWTVTRPCAAWLAETLAADPALPRFFRHTLIPDELVFPTLVSASPFAGRLAGTHLRLIEFPAGSAHPRVWRESDLPRLRGPGIFFARKFDPAVDPVVLDRLDAAAGRER